MLLLSVGCAASVEPITFSVTRPPVIPLSPESKVLHLGFAGEETELASRLDGLFVRGLRTNRSMTILEPGAALRGLAGWSHSTNALSDSLIVEAGLAVDADIVVVGRLARRYTEQYGEEKKYRVVEAFRPSGNAMQIRLDSMPYYEPYINQIADLQCVLRVIPSRQGAESLVGAVGSVDTLHVVLPAPVIKPPKGAVVVDRITPVLADRALSKLADNLVGLFARRTVMLSRQVHRRVDDGAALTALRAGDWGGARRSWERLTQEKPDNAAAWNNLAVVYEALGLQEDARKAYRKALDLAPRDTAIRANSHELP